MTTCATRWVAGNAPCLSLGHDGLTARCVRVISTWRLTGGQPEALALPWDLQTALRQPSMVHPGDEIWVRGGEIHRQFHQSASRQGESSDNRSRIPRRASDAGRRPAIC